MERKPNVSIVFFLLLLLMPCASYAQKPSGVVSKLPAGITAENIKQVKQVFIITNGTVFLNGRLRKAANNMLLYVADVAEVNIDSILHAPDVFFIQPLREAKEEMVISGADLSLNNIFFSHDTYPAVTGKGLTVSIKENRPDSLDIDFRNRYVRTGMETSTLSSHATTIMTLIGGAGNTYYTGKGVAYGAQLTSASFQVLLPEHDTVYKKYNLGVQNHSYGTGIENYYGADSWAYDLSINNNDSLLHVFSAGNSGTQTSTAGKYAGIVGFANLTGSFKQSKNSLSIAATDSFYNVEVLSSKGPAYDGRIKPELVAFGKDGSSGAAALVSGSALLIQDACKQKTGKLPSSALVRASLINSADDLLQPGPDYTSGFGSLNTERAVRQIISNQHFTASVSNGNVQQFNITIPANSKELRVTIAWNDIAANINASKALVNDLDLEVEEINTGIIHYPFVLSSYPHTDSLNAIAEKKKDTLNNVEQVVIGLPSPGNYILRVKGTYVQGNQAFAVAYNAEPINTFAFTYPTRSSNLYSGITNIIRWSSTAHMSSPGTLQITYNGADWITLGSSFNLSSKYYKAFIKDTVCIARLRMNFGSAYILSDTFTISPRLQMNVGYNCPDSFQLYWNKLNGVTSYHVYALADTFMTLQQQTADTSVVIAANAIQYYAVAPIINNKTGLRSYTLNYTTQSAGCFINSFLADVFDDTAVHLHAALGSIHGIKEISFQRLYPLTTLAAFQVNTDTFSTTDVLLNDGMYYYRAKIISDNGKEIFSDVLPVRIFQRKQFFVYPNPYNNNGRLVIQSKDHDNAIFELFSIAGQKVLTRKLESETQQLNLAPLHTGIYFYHIIQNGKRNSSGKLVIY